MVLVASTTAETFGGWALSNVTLIFVELAPDSEMLTPPPSAGAEHVPWAFSSWPSIVTFPRAVVVLAGAIVAVVVVWLLPPSASRTRPPVMRSAGTAVCAADAQLARIHLTGPAAATAASYPGDTWLRVAGTVIPGSSTAASSFVPTMNVTTVTKIDRPANTYAY